MKDIDKLISGNADAYSAFKHTLESLPDGVVVIGSHTQHKQQEGYISLHGLQIFY